MIEYFRILPIKVKKADRGTDVVHTTPCMGCRQLIPTIGGGGGEYLCSACHDLLKTGTINTNTK